MNVQRTNKVRIVNNDAVNDRIQNTFPEKLRTLWDMRCDVKELLGKTLVEVLGAEVGSDGILFVCSDGSEYLMYHEQDCCENVDINDICGEVSRLIGNPLLKAEAANSCENPALDIGPVTEYDDSHTWTFYHFATIKGYVNIRWYGESNGYYSEEVDFIKLK